MSPSFSKPLVRSLIEEKIYIKAACFFSSSSSDLSDSSEEEEEEEEEPKRSTKNTGPKVKGQSHLSRSIGVMTFIRRALSIKFT